MSKIPIDRNSSGNEPIALNGQTMGTRYSAMFLPVSGLDIDALATALFEAVDLVDREMSTWIAASDLMRLNAADVGQWVALPPALMDILQTGLAIGRDTNGAFDVGLGDLTNVWGFGATGKQPDAAKIKAHLGKSRSPAHEILVLDPAQGRAQKQTALAVDLSGIAKGYAVDRMVDCLRQHGVSSALAGLDGELRAIGLQEDGHPWPVAIERPDYDHRAPLSIVALSDAAIATSGDYRHWIDVGDTRLSHTMSRLSGGPVQNEIASVSVIAKTCTEADAWATALLVMGPVAGHALAKAKGIDALFITRAQDALTQIGTGPTFGDA